MRRTNRKKYYKDLDFIRVIACIAILMYHLNILKGGYLAVCTFLVLSGYLSCISASSKKKFSLKEYYINKLKRLYLPLLIVVFITIGIISLIPEINFFNLKSETTSIIFGYNNFWQLEANLDYFARHINSPFMHLWYIAILLQFDLIFPFIYLLFRKIGDKFNKSISCIGIAILSIIFSIYFGFSSVNNNMMFTYYNTFTRIFSLLFGMSLGFIQTHYNNIIFKKIKNSKIIFYGYVVILILLFIFMDAKSSLLFIGILITTFISCRLIDYGTFDKKKNISGFDKVIKFISDMSYEIYLVQYPIIFLFQYIDMNMYLKLPIMIILVFMISYLLHIIINFNKKEIRYKIFKYIVRGIVLGITFFGVYKYLMAPDNTKEMNKLREQMIKNQEMMKQRQKEYEINLREEENDWLKELENIKDGEDKIKNIVSDLSVVGIGDSVLLGATQYLYNRFPKGYFDGETSRTAWQVSGILQSLKNRDMLGNPIVLNLGANGDCSLSCKIDIIEMCEDRDIFWINVVNDNDVLVNDKLLSLAESYSNLHIIDWNSISRGHPEYFIADGIHLTDVGSEAYVKAIYEAIYQVYLERYNDKKKEIIKEHDEEIMNKITFYGNDILLYAFEDIKNNFSDANFNVDSEFSYEKLKVEIEKAISNKSMTGKIVFAFDSNMDMKIEEYQDLIRLCGDRVIYILSTDEKVINNLLGIKNDNVIIIDMYKEIKNNSNYLMSDKIHLTDEGNKILSKIIIDRIK